MVPDLILGIESSCDDSSVALLSLEGQVVSMLSQAHLTVLQPFGGVMPEVVSREHARALPLLLQEILPPERIARLKAIAYTAGPGLPGSLLIASHCAHTLHTVTGLPLLPIHHIEGHLLAYELEHEPLCYPFISLIVSGGHTQLVLTHGPFDYEIVGKTRDDAAGEAYDKVAKMIGFDYPGGPKLAALADRGTDLKIFTRPLLSDKKCLDFSFSGLKTQARLLWETFQGSTEDFCASVQAAINETLVTKLERALEQFPLVRGINLCGGVACNSDLRQRVTALGAKKALRVVYASNQYCSDNAAMIAIAGLRHLEKQGPALQREGLFSRSSWPLGQQ